MTHEERLKQIDEYFKNLSIEEFEQNLIDCGINEIKPASYFGYELKSVHNCCPFNNMTKWNKFKLWIQNVPYFFMNLWWKITGKYQ